MTSTVINIGAIEHDPYVLMGYLTAVYQDFSYSEAEGVLRQLFQEQYSLSFSEETEIRYRTETTIDPGDRRGNRGRSAV